MADYDEGEVTEREELAADRQKGIADYNANTLKKTAKYNRETAKNIASWSSGMQNKLAGKNAAQTTDVAKYNAKATRNQLGNQFDTYDFANRQNASLRDTQFKQASRKSEAERFEAQRQLQNAALGLFGTMNQAMNGSTVGNTMRMLENRNDADNSTYWQNLQDNRNAIQNAYDESYNQNQVAKRDAAVNALKALQDIQGDLSSNLGNIQSDLFANLVNIRGDLLTNVGNNRGDLYANLRNLQGDLAANLNNINPNLYEDPSNIKVPESGYKIPDNWSRIGTMQNSSGNMTKNPIYKAPGSNAAIRSLEDMTQNDINSVREHNATLLDYIMPANAEQNVRDDRNVLARGDYFSDLINGFNRVDVGQQDPLQAITRQNQAATQANQSRAKSLSNQVANQANQNLNNRAMMNQAVNQANQNRMAVINNQIANRANQSKANSQTGNKKTNTNKRASSNKAANNNRVNNQRASQLNNLINQINARNRAAANRIANYDAMMRVNSLNSRNR